MDKIPVLLYKTQAVIIIILFIGVTFIPSIHANIDNEKGLPPDLAILSIYSYYEYVPIYGRLCLFFSPVIQCRLSTYDGDLIIEGQVRRLFSAEPVITGETCVSRKWEKGDIDYEPCGMFVKNLPPFIYIISFKLLPEEQEIIKLNNELFQLNFIAGSFNIRAILYTFGGHS